MTMALMFALMMNLFAYWFSDKIVLKMYRAKEVREHEAPELYSIVRRLAQKAEIPMPRVYIINEDQPNAFATGRNPEHAAVAVTKGILQILNPRELRGVLAHEISHIQNRDILVSTIVASIASAIMYLAHMLQWIGFMGHRRDENNRGGIHPLAMLFTIILAPLVATMVQAAISRTREFMADESGAHVSADPEALASALQKISDPKLIKQFQRDEMMPDMQPAFSHLYIVNHFSGKSVFNWFATHPPVKERVRRLLELKKNRIQSA
jgi:heat shock protein HtpX